LHGDTVVTRTHLLVPLALLAALGCDRALGHSCQSVVECGVGWDCVQGTCQLPTSTDAGLDRIGDGPTDSQAGDCDGGCAPQICVVGTANCDTSNLDCESRIADQPGCFPSYAGTTVLTTGSLSVTAVAIGDDGAVYLGGGFLGTADFDPGDGVDVRSAAGTPDGFITKLNPDGSRAWTTTFGATASVTSIAVSATSLTVVGGYSGAVDFDSGPGVAARTVGGGFILKLTLDGAFSWVSTLESGSYCFPHGMSEDDEGNIYVVGEYNGFCDFDPGPGVEQRGPVINTTYAYVVSITGQGALRWVHTYEGSACQSALSGVAVTRDGNAWVAGQTVGSCFLDGDVARPLPSSGALLAALDPSGSPSFTWTVGHDSTAFSRAVVAGADGSVYVAGTISEAVDFDSGPGVAMGSPAMASRPAPRSDRTSAGFVLNLTAGGAFRSVYTMAGIDVTGLSTLSDRGLLVMGNPVTSAGSGGGLFLTKLQADFTPGWSLYACGSSCGGLALAAGPSTFLVAGLNGGGAIDIDPGPAVDLLPSGEGFSSGVAFLSRYTF
jgi:hypothetical protein